MTNKCSRCQGKGYVWVSNGPDDCDKDYCDDCDGTGMTTMPEPEHISTIIQRVMPKGGDDKCFDVLCELTDQQNDAVSNISYLADGVSCDYAYAGKRYVVTIKPERLVK